MSDSFTYYFIVNRRANSGRAVTFFKEIEQEIRSRFKRIEVYYTASIDEIKDIIDANDSVHSVFVACGGDGTVHAVAKQLVHKKSILGVLPLGSGNDFAKMLGKEISGNSYLDILETGFIEKFDTISWNNELCINTFGLGIDGLTNQYAAESRFIRGKLKYIYCALKAIFKVDKASVTIHVENEKKAGYFTYLTLISNGRWEGGSYQLSPHSVPTDGKFELQIAKIDTRLQLLVQFIRLSIFGKFSKQILQKYSCTRALISFDTMVPAHCDGEIVEPVKEISFEMNAASLKVLVQQ